MCESKPNEPQQVEPWGCGEKRKLARDFVAGLTEVFDSSREALIQDRRKSNLAGLNQLQCRREPFRSHPYSFPDESLTTPRNAVGAASIERRALGERSGRTVPCQSFLNSGSAFSKGLNGVVYVEQILCPVGRLPPVMDENLLHEERYRIWDLNKKPFSCRIPGGRADLNCPGRDQKQINVPQLLCGYTGNGSSRIAPAALVQTADERRQELRVEPSVASSQAIMNCRRPRVPEEFLFKPARSQAGSHTLGLLRQFSRHRNIRLPSKAKLLHP